MRHEAKPTCPACRVEMSYHGLLAGRGPDRGVTAGRASGGILRDFYSCPKCGRTATPTERDAGRKAA
jgi:hypothetical protein